MSLLPHFLHPVFPAAETPRAFPAFVACLSTAPGRVRPTFCFDRQSARASLSEMSKPPYRRVGTEMAESQRPTF